MTLIILCANCGQPEPNHPTTICGVFTCPAPDVPPDFEFVRRRSFKEMQLERIANALEKLVEIKGLRTLMDLGEVPADSPKDTRCMMPSTTYVTVGNYGGTGWCVCDKHVKSVIERTPVGAVVRQVPIEKRTDVLDTHAGIIENRRRCVWDERKHGTSAK